MGPMFDRWDIGIGFGTDVRESGDGAPDTRKWDMRPGFVSDGGFGASDRCTGVLIDAG